MKPMIDLLKLKPKVDKIITAITINRIKQKLLKSTRMIIVKMIDQFIQIKMQIVQLKNYFHYKLDSKI